MILPIVPIWIFLKLLSYLFFLSKFCQSSLKVDPCFKSLLMSFDICLNCKGSLVHILVSLLARRPNKTCVQWCVSLWKQCTALEIHQKWDLRDSGECWVLQLPQSTYWWKLCYMLPVKDYTYPCFPGRGQSPSQANQAQLSEINSIKSEYGSEK